MNQNYDPKLVPMVIPQPIVWFMGASHVFEIKKKVLFDNHIGHKHNPTKILEAYKRAYGDMFTTFPEAPIPFVLRHGEPDNEQS